MSYVKNKYNGRYYTYSGSNVSYADLGNDWKSCYSYETIMGITHKGSQIFMDYYTLTPSVTSSRHISQHCLHLYPRCLIGDCGEGLVRNIATPLWVAYKHYIMVQGIRSSGMFLNRHYLKDTVSFVCYNYTDKQYELWECRVIREWRIGDELPDPQWNLKKVYLKGKCYKAKYLKEAYDLARGEE